MTSYISNQLGNHLAYLVLSSHCVSSVPSKSRRYCPATDFLADQADTLSELYIKKLFFITSNPIELTGWSPSFQSLEGKKLEIWCWAASWPSDGSERVACLPLTPLMVPGAFGLGSTFPPSPPSSSHGPSLSVLSFVLLSVSQPLLPFP